MAFLIDTNVISETFRPRPAPQVLEWVGHQMAGDLFLAAVSLGELVRGARRVKGRAKRERFAHWINHDLATQFQDRVLPFDREAAVIWGAIMGDGDRAGRPKSIGRADRCGGVAARPDPGHTQYQRFQRHGGDAGRSVGGGLISLGCCGKLFDCSPGDRYALSLNRSVSSFWVLSRASRNESRDRVPSASC